MVKYYIKGEQGGWDASGKRWRDKRGRYATREAALGLAMQDEWGMALKLDFAPTSTNLEAIDRVMGGLVDVAGYKKPDQLLAAIVEADLGDSADPMPSDILAMMKLAEYFIKVEGDVWQTIEVPLTVGLKQLVIEGPDEGLEKDIRQLYESLDMLEILTQLWLCVAIYGQAFPLEVYDKKESKGVLILNPKYMRVGKTVTMGRYSLDLIPETEALRKELETQTEKKLMYNTFASDWNEQVAKGHNVPLEPEFCHPVRGLGLAFHRYVVPPLARAFRRISTRQVLEELIRATIEGYRNQLWLFKLGADGHEASPQKKAYFQSLITGAAGDRTGHLIWTWDIEAEILTPEPIDEVLGSEKRRDLTQDIFRDLGISMRLISGESPVREGRGAEEADIRIFLERLDFWRRRVIAWAMGFNRRWLEQTGKSKYIDKLPLVKFGRVFLEIEELIRSLIMPLLQAGVLSRKTALETAGFNYEAELQRKKEEQPYIHLFAPAPTFAQTTVKPGTPEKESLTAPRGRPPDAQNPEQLLKASQIYMEYRDKVLSAYDEALEAEDKKAAITKFISALAVLNADYMKEAAQLGYITAGGSGDLPEDYVQRAIDWNNDYLAGFEGALLEAAEDEKALKKMQRRAKMYADQGDKIAFMFGVFWFMKEQGARGWRRVLHPELSLTGPCELCIADSVLIHPIDEPFSDHPEGVCSAQSLYFYWTERPMEEIPRIFPVPRRRDEKRIVRRIR